MFQGVFANTGTIDYTGQKLLSRRNLTNYIRTGHTDSFSSSKNNKTSAKQKKFIYNLRCILSTVGILGGTYLLFKSGLVKKAASLLDKKVSKSKSFANFVSSIKQGWQNAGTAAKNAANKVSAGAKNTFNKAKTTGKNAAEHIKNTASKANAADGQNAAQAAPKAAESANSANAAKAASNAVNTAKSNPVSNPISASAQANSEFEIKFDEDAVAQQKGLPVEDKEETKKSTPKVFNP